MKFSKLLLAIFFYSMIEGWENMESNSLIFHFVRCSRISGQQCWQFI